MKNPSTISSGESDALTLPFAILDDELAALHRFYETTEDGQDYDVPVPMMKRLAVIGLVRRVTGNRYGFTDFGLSVRNGDFSAALATQPAESKACASVGVEPAARADHCQGPECRDGVLHKSDCAVHNEPAYPAGPCDCGATS